jgi:cyclic pyranopterin phosphate synthase
MKEDAVPPNSENEHACVARFGEDRMPERHINYLRVSVTDLCNYRCTYCMPPHGVKRLPHSEILTFEEICTVVGAAIPLGINKLRLTGGEPLVRKGVPELVEMLGRLHGLKEIYLTTNGSMLDQLASALKKSGLTRINISLDSLKAEKYNEITRGGDLKKVWKGIRAAADAGFEPIKLNVVVISGINDDEIEDFAALTIKNSYEIRFIEYMPFGPKEISGKFAYVAADEMKRRIRSVGNLLPLPRRSLSGPAERFQLEGAQGTLGFIAAMSHSFCPKCNRIRLTADGRLLSCLFSGQSVEVKSLIRTGAPISKISEAIRLAIASKPASRAASCENFMSSIGG